MLGVRAGGGAEQTNMLQAAIDQTAGARVPLVLGPGEYRVGALKLPTGRNSLACAARPGSSSPAARR